jgi:hypothetical protein
MFLITKFEYNHFADEEYQLHVSCFLWLKKNKSLLSFRVYKPPDQKIELTGVRPLVSVCKKRSDALPLVETRNL